MRLLSANILEAREPEFDARRGQLPSHYVLSLLDEPRTGRIFKFYLLLTELPTLVADLELSAEELFWNRYYWFLRYVKLRQALIGPDAGLEQQAFPMLEYPHPACSPDWSILDEVELEAERGVAAQLEYP